MTDLWCEVHCTGCTKVVTIPLKLAARAQPKCTLQQYLVRLVCKQCGGRVKTAEVADHAILNSRHTIGTSATWTVQVLP